MQTRKVINYVTQEAKLTSRLLSIFNMRYGNMSSFAPFNSLCRVWLDSRTTSAILGTGMIDSANVNNTSLPDRNYRRIPAVSSTIPTKWHKCQYPIQNLTKPRLRKFLSFILLQRVWLSLSSAATLLKV